jgi:hypothetical protein
MQPVPPTGRRYASGEWRVAFGDLPFEALPETRFANPRTVDREGLVVFFQSMGWFGELPASERVLRSLLDAPECRRSWETPRALDIARRLDVARTNSVACASFRNVPRPV